MSLLMAAAEEGGERSWNVHAGLAGLRRFLLPLLMAFPVHAALFSFLLINDWRDPSTQPMIVTLMRLNMEPPSMERPKPLQRQRHLPRKRVRPQEKPKRMMKKRPIAARAPVEAAPSPRAPEIETHEEIRETLQPEEYVPVPPVLSFTQLDAMPRLIRQVEPEYPLAARRAGIEGRIVLKALIEPDGTVSEVRVLKSMAEIGFDAAAIEAVRQWLFTVPRMGSQPVRVWMILPIHFTLTD